MPRTNLLVVLIVRDPALRSTLTAQLSLAGHELLTMSEVRDPGLQPRARPRAALVMDEAAAASRSPEWIEVLLAGWWRILVLTEGAADALPEGNGQRLAVAAASLPATLAALAESWRADPPPG